MSQPLWTRLGFAVVVPIVLIGVATVVLWRAVLYARMNVPVADRVQPDTTRAVLFMILSMLLVVMAIVLPLVIRARAQKRLQR
jgi:heme/copper-type cytochrome/quinol oxidase subunit 2